MSDPIARLQKQCETAENASPNHRKDAVDQVVQLTHQLLASDDEIPKRAKAAAEQKERQKQAAQHQQAKARIERANAWVGFAVLGITALALTMIGTVIWGSMSGTTRAMTGVGGAALLLGAAFVMMTTDAQLPSPVRRQTLAGFSFAAALAVAAFCWGFTGGTFGVILLAITVAPSVVMTITELDASPKPSTTEQKQ